MKLNKVKFRIFLFFLLLSSICKGTTFYVSKSGGNDANSGLNPKQPWKSFAKVSNRTFQPGDSILFKRGDTWREALFIPSSGSSSKKIVFSTYGSGEAPVILGSDQALKWTSLGNNIWKSDPIFKVNPFFIRGTGSGNLWTINHDQTVNTGIYKNTLADLKGNNHWCYSTNSIYLYSIGDPAVQFKSVEVTTRPTGISLSHKEYIEINGINIFYANVGIYESTTPESVNVNGLIVRNCELGYLGYPDGNGVGMHAFYSNSLIENNIIHDCGRRGISLSIVTSSFTIKNVVIQNNSFYHGYHTTSVDLQGTKGYTGGCDSIIFRNNYIYDLPDYSPPVLPMQMFISDQGSTNQMTNIFIYNNIFKYASGASININGIENLNIYNNTFYGHNIKTRLQSAFLFIGKSSVNVKNNIFYSQITSAANDNGLAYILVDKDLFSRLSSDYNCYYRTAANLPVIKCAYPYFVFGKSNFSSLQTIYGWETHALLKDPMFVSTSNLNLQPLSPCVERGIDVGLPYNGTAPNIGAVPSTSFLNDEALFLSFSIGNQIGKTIIDVPQKSIKLTVPYGTALNKLIAKFSVSSGAIVKVGNVIQISGSTGNNFSTTLTYKVFAQDRITIKEWKVTVEVAPNTKSEITSFNILGQKGNTIINSNTHSIAVTMPHEASLAGLIASFAISSGASAFVSSVVQSNNSTPNNFTGPVIYKVVAQDGVSFTNWTINVKNDTLALPIEREQTINLTSGWNIISFNVLPAKTDLKEIFQPLIQSGKLVKVQDEEGNFMVDTINGWYSNLKNLDVTKGYNVNVAEDARLKVKGQHISNYNISLNKGFNILGYPFGNSQLPLPKFQSLLDRGLLIKVQDEKNNTLVKINDQWVCNIDSLRPGKGYYICVSENTTFDYSSLKANGLFAYSTSKNNCYFQKAFVGNPFSSMNFILKDLKASNLNLEVGDEIGIFNGNSCVGTTCYNGENILGVSAGMNDLSTSITGFTPGDSINFQIWKASEQTLLKEVYAKYLSNSPCVFTSQGTAIVQLQKQVFPVDTSSLFLKEISALKNYPNPFHMNSSFEFTLTKRNKVLIEIFNMMGEKITEVMNSDLDPGNYQISWDGTNQMGKKVSPGIYIYQFKAGNFFKSNKIIFVKVS